MSALGDLFWNNVSLLLHFDGYGSIVVDERKHPVAVTPGALQQNKESVFGGSCQFDGALGAVTCDEFQSNLVGSNWQDYYFASGPFTIEGWFKTNQNNRINATLAERSPQPMTAGGWRIVINVSAASDGHLGFFWGDINISVACMESGANFADGYWHHVAVVRNGNLFYMFADGALVATAISATSQTDLGSQKIILGNSTGAGRGYAGYLDEWRITKGIPRYTVSFTPTPAGKGQSTAAVAQTTLALPNPPEKYDVADQRQTRRLIEQALK